MAAEAKMNTNITAINIRRNLLLHPQYERYIPSSSSAAVAVVDSSRSKLAPPPASPDRRRLRFSSFRSIIIRAGSKKKQPPIEITRKSSKKSPRRRVIKISCPSNGLPGRWSSDYVVSLKDLQLSDLAEDGRMDTQVNISVSVDKHAGFGMSVEGRVVSSISRICSCCSSPYFNEVDTKFNVWILPSSNNKKENDDPFAQLPEIGGDPSVMYVRPGHEADLDSLVQETIRLQISTMETCSELCDKAQPKMHHIGVQKTASLDRRWSKLLELRKDLS